jgi:hypothetical protein
MTRIDVELTQDEADTLLYALGTETGIAALQKDEARAKRLIHVVNKLFSSSPDFIPYDEDSYDATQLKNRGGLAFERVKTT